MVRLSKSQLTEGSSSDSDQDVFRRSLRTAIRDSNILFNLPHFSGINRLLRRMDSGNPVAPTFLPNPMARHGHTSQVNGHAAADPNSIMNQFANMSLSSMNVPNSAGPLHLPPGHAFMMGPDGHLMVTPMHGQPMALGSGSESLYPNFSVASNAYGAPYVGLPVPVMPYTPNRMASTGPAMDRGHSDVPALENRRGSYSTTESTPATPFYGNAHRDGARVASLDRSSYTTPSPQQIGMASLHAEGSKATIPTISDRNLDELMKKEPAIPKAVPAVFTPAGQMKNVDQSLENRISGNRNVYIRGLHPTTDDELLYHFASRFGPVETSKAIIDTGTGACKGFGFAKFFEAADSELCIRGFHRLGYEVGFARESFNSRLKAEGDDQSTNLYISNLPKTLTEVELGTIFLGYTILSSKILRDSMGNSRGVGFARFENREVCDEVIRKFNGVGIGEEGLLMNIRYADTPAQKELKRVTAERRQFRTNEYNIGAYGTPLVGLNPAMYGQQSQWRRSIPQSRSGLSASSSGDANVQRPSDAHNGPSETALDGEADVAATSTLSESECDEGATIRPDPIDPAAASEVVIPSHSPLKPTASK